MLAVFLAVRPVDAQTVYDDAQNAYPILLAGQNARAAALGGESAALADDVAALGDNPAGLALIEAAQLSLLHHGLLAGGFSETAAYGFSIRGAGTFAIGLNFLNYGEQQRRDDLGNATGTFSPQDVGLKGGFGFPIEKGFLVGLSSHWIRQEIDGNARMGLGMGAGMMLKDDDLSMGLALRNVGVDSGGSPYSEEVAIGAARRFGLAREGKQELLLNAGVGVPFRGALRLGVGAEVGLEGNYFLRAGYNGILRDRLVGGLDGLSFGAGARFDGFQLDYAFSFLGDLGNFHRVSFRAFLPTPFPTGEPQGEASVAPIVLPALPETPGEAIQNPVRLKFKVTTQEDRSAEELFEQAEGKLRLGLEKEAMDLYLKAVEQDPSLEAAWHRLGALYFMESMGAYRKALEANPRNERLREWLERYQP